MDRESSEHRSVTVCRGGEDVVTIETNCLSGRDITPADEQAIRWAASNLLGFLGEADHQWKRAAELANDFASARTLEWTLWRARAEQAEADTRRVGAENARLFEELKECKGNSVSGDPLKQGHAFVIERLREQRDQYAAELAHERQARTTSDSPEAILKLQELSAELKDTDEKLKEAQAECARLRPYVQHLGKCATQQPSYIQYASNMKMVCDCGLIPVSPAQQETK